MPLRDIVKVSQKSYWRQFQTLNGRKVFRLEIRLNKGVRPSKFKDDLLSKLDEKGISYLTFQLEVVRVRSILHLARLSWLWFLVLYWYSWL